MVSKDKLKQLFSPSLTGKDTYSADEILLSIETMPDNEPTFWQVYEYCDKRNWAIIPMDNIDDEVPKLSIPIEWLMKHSEYGVIERWLKIQEKENETEID